MEGRTAIEIEHAAREQLKLILAFFPRVDTMVATVLSLDLGMMAVLASRLPNLKAMSWLATLALVPAVLVSATSLFHLYRAAFPRLSGGQASLVYFGEIAARTEKAFVAAFLDQRGEKHARDLLEQSWRNAEILAAKFRAVRKAFLWLAVAVVPWIGAIATLQLTSPH